MSFSLWNWHLKFYYNNYDYHSCMVCINYPFLISHPMLGASRISKTLLDWLRLFKRSQTHSHPYFAFLFSLFLASITLSFHSFLLISSFLTMFGEQILNISENLPSPMKLFEKSSCKASSSGSNIGAPLKPWGTHFTRRAPPH